jgi:ribonuclease PH
LHIALAKLVADGALKSIPLTDQVVAVSCGIYQDTSVLDLDYPEDSNAQTDANFVLTGTGNIIEIQGTAEESPFSRAQFLELLDLAEHGGTQLAVAQRHALGLD